LKDWEKEEFKESSDNEDVDIAGEGDEYIRGFIRALEWVVE